MNQQNVKEKWTEFKSEIRRMWDKVTDNSELDNKVSGTTERLSDLERKSRDEVSPKGQNSDWTDQEPH